MACAILTHTMMYVASSKVNVITFYNNLKAILYIGECHYTKTVMKTLRYSGKCRLHYAYNRPINIFSNAS